VISKRFSSVITLFMACWTLLTVPAISAPSKHALAPARSAFSGGHVYQQFRGPNGLVIRWISDQMPLKVYVSPGTTLDSLVDPELGASYMCVDDRDRWPDIVANVVQNPDQLNSLPQAVGYVPQHYQAAVQGINSWQKCGGGLYSYQITQDPSDADIYVFWTNHFVNKLGLALFENDIRGYTAKRSFPLKAIMSGQKAQFRPVVTLLRTTEGAAGTSMRLAWMQASAAHEFGHALGIEGHSPDPNDLMSVYYGHGVISANDAATIRFLYKASPDYIP
jgi:predicted Zn-dependent protease